MNMLCYYEQILLDGSNVLNAAGITVLCLGGGKVAEGVRIWEWGQRDMDKDKERNQEECHRQTLTLQCA